MWRQGDVLIIPVTAIPKGLNKQPRDAGRIVLAYGEATGHAHAIADHRADLYGDQLDQRFIRVLAEGGVDLIHEEHATITIPPGTYRVIRQREYTPEADRFVTD